MELITPDRIEDGLWNKLIPKVMPDDFNLFCFGDMHIGSVLFFEKGFNKMKAMMHRSYANCKNNYGVCHGDCIEAICIDDPRYQKQSTAEDSIFQQIKMAVKQLDGIKGQLICLLEGNHETKLHRFGSIGEEIADRLEVPFGTYTARITYEFSDGSKIKQFATHGARGISSTADDTKRRNTNMMLQLKRHLKMKSHTCALSTEGHTHKLISCPPDSELYIDDNGIEMQQHYTQPIQSGYSHHEQRYFGNTGSFMKLYELGISGYAERFGYDPIELGWLIARFRNKQLVGLDRIVL